MDPRAAWRVLRPANAAMTAAGVAVGAVAAAGVGAADALVPVAAGALAGFTFAGAGNALNDVLDVDVDRRAHPDRPIASGRLSRREGRLVAALGFAASLAFGAIVGPLGLALVIVALGLMLAYELRLKARGLAGNAAIGLLTGAPFVLGAIAVDALGPVAWTLMGLATLATLGREVLKDIEDMHGDAGRRTLPLQVGPETASLVAAAALVLGVVLSPLPVLVPEGLGPVYLGLVAVADAGFVGAAWTGRRDAGRAQRLAKLSMVVALGAFVAGRLVPR